MMWGCCSWLSVCIGTCICHMVHICILFVIYVRTCCLTHNHKSCSSKDKSLYMNSILDSDNVNDRFRVVIWMLDCIRICSLQVVWHQVDRFLVIYVIITASKNRFIICPFATHTFQHHMTLKGMVVVISTIYSSDRRICSNTIYQSCTRNWNRYRAYVVLVVFEILF